MIIFGISLIVIIVVFYFIHSRLIKKEKDLHSKYFEFGITYEWEMIQAVLFKMYNNEEILDYSSLVMAINKYVKEYGEDIKIYKNDIDNLKNASITSKLKRVLYSDPVSN
jgi:hypothetical protein